MKWVDSQNNVVFQPVELLSTDSEGAWITGLPESVPVIHLGGGYVRPGQQVNAIPLMDSDADLSATPAYPVSEQGAIALHPGGVN